MLRRTSAPAFFLATSLCFPAGAGAAGAPPTTDPSTAQPSSQSETDGSARPPGPHGDDVSPPRLLEAATVEYPQAALDQGVVERVEVELVLELDRFGVVMNVGLAGSSQHELFERAALEAAKALRFEPATRGGVTVGAKIRFRYVFEPPPPKAPPVAAAPTQAAEPLEPAPPTPEGEVVVRGERAEPGARSLTRSEVRRMPGAFGDAFRAVDALPGMTPIVSGLPYAFLRGAPPGNVGYFLDGIRVPTLYHVAFGPAVLSPALIDHVELYPSGAPVRFGHSAGGVIAASTTTPRPDFHAEGSLRLFDAGAHVETGFAGGRGSLLLGGRYSYTATLLSLLDQNTKVDYRDYQARLTYDLTPDDRVAVLSFGSYDFLGQHDKDVILPQYGVEFYRVDLSYTHALDARASSVSAAVTLGYDAADAGSIAGAPRQARDRSLVGRIELKQRLAETATLRAGLGASWDAYALGNARYEDTGNPETARFEARYAPRTDQVFWLWADLPLLLGPVELTPGVRGDLYASRGVEKLAADPRLSARVNVTDTAKVLAGVGIASQAPSQTLPIGALAPLLQGGLQRSFQSSLGFELAVARATTLTTTGFYSYYTRLTDDLGTTNPNVSAPTELRPSGRAFGGELLLYRRLSERIGGLLSYTVSRSTRILGTREVPSAFDRTHVLNAIVSIDFGRGYGFGVRGLFYSGAPRAGFDLASRTPARDPTHVRLDARIEKRWSFKKRGFVAIVAELLNSTFSADYVQGRRQAPWIIPSLGVEAGI